MSKTKILNKCIIFFFHTKIIPRHKNSMNKTLAIAGTILTIVAISTYSQQAFAEEIAPGLLVKE